MQLYLSDGLADDVGTHQLGCSSNAGGQESMPSRSMVALQGVSG